MQTSASGVNIKIKSILMSPKARGLSADEMRK